MPIWPFKRKPPRVDSWAPSSAADPRHPDHAAYLKADAVIKRHLDIGQQMTVAYRDRDRDPKALARAIALCEKQIAMSDEAINAFRWEYGRLAEGSDAAKRGEPLRMPTHPGYAQLAIIREKEGRLKEAVALARRARDQGWNGDWDARIDRLNRKRAKAASGESS